MPLSSPAATTPSAMCPFSPPVTSSPCASFGLECTWGSDPREDCRTWATCARRPSGAPAWVVMNRDCPALKASCPATASPSSPDGGPCADSELGLTCMYCGTAYTCADNCIGGVCFSDPNPNHWFMTALDARCPSSVPNLGDQCADQALVCDYNHYSRGLGAVCQDGLWQIAGVACPFAANGGSGR